MRSLAFKTIISTMALGPHVLGPGKYHVRVYADSGHSSTQAYRLTVTY